MVDPLLIRATWLPGETALSLVGSFARANSAIKMSQFGNDTGLDVKRLGRTKW